jgi:ligand-binding sensor domain-containing protein
MRFLLISFTLLISVFAQAQQPYFSKLNINYQSSGIKFQKIYEDETGILWIGTNEGIIRFNGKTSKLIRLPRQNGHRITAMIGNDTFVFASDDQGIIYKINTHLNYTVEHTAYNEDAVTALFISKTNLLVGTASSGILIYDDFKFQRVLDASNILSDNAIHFIKPSNNYIAIGTDAGIQFLDKDFKLHKLLTTADGLSDNLIYAANNDAQTLVIGTHNGELNKIDPTLKIEVTSFPASDQPIRFILKKNQEWIIISDYGNLQIATQDFTSVYESKYTQLESFNANDEVTDAIIDKEGNLIICQNKDQILLADLQFLYTVQHEGASFENISAIHHDQHSRLWLATKQGLCYHSDQFIPGNKLQFVSKENKDPKTQIICIRERSDGKIWYGMYGAGLGIYDPITNERMYISNPTDLSDGNIFSICENGDEMWLATLNGVFIAKETNGKLSVEENDVTNAYSRIVYKIFKDREERIWLATVGKGAAYFSNQKITPVFETSESIIDITQDRDGNIWFLNSENEIIIWNDDFISRQKLPVQRGFAHILAIEADLNGKVTALTQEGIFSVNSNKNELIFYPSKNGINSNYLDIITNDKNYQWLALENALVRFEIENTANRTQPIPIIDHVFVALQPVDTLIHQFPYHENHFSFQISALWFKQLEDLNFRYRLLGLDTTWVQTNDAEIVFPKLSPGDYRFELQASVNDQWNNCKTTSYYFQINKPIWQQWWFIVISILLVVSIVGYTITYRIKIRESKLALRQEQTQVQLDTLRNQINPHFLFNSFNALINAIHHDKEVAIDYVEKLSDYYRQILENQNKQVILLGEELDLVNNYLFLQKQRFADNLSASIHLDDEVLKTCIPPMTLQLLVENAIKHNSISKSCPLKIEIFNQRDLLFVKNTISPKIHPEKSTGVGLQNIKSRYSLLFSKHIEISKSNTHFEVILPIIDSTHGHAHIDH